MAAIEAKIFPVRGFRCSGCADKLGQSLRRLEGVIRAEAHDDSGQVQVRFDPARVADEDIAEGIRAAGFDTA